ncbi:MAG: hypothetical protein K0U84_13565 [Actinomycetia bacterium]|nr:hypothetical protein [Actinomycetes bacterium]
MQPESRFFIQDPPYYLIEKQASLLQTRLLVGAVHIHVSDLVDLDRCDPDEILERQRQLLWRWMGAA